MPECTHLARTSAYFDGALAVADEAEALAHLPTCAECQAFLRDAVTFDAVISQAPAKLRALPRRRRWPIAIAAVGALAAAAVALWIALPRGAEPVPEVAIALPRERAIEARFSGERFGAYRPYDPLRGDRAHESIAIRTLAELERRGDVADLFAALVATGDLARAQELAAALPDPAVGESDRAALALAADASEDALGHAYHAVDRAPELAAGWWNLALAARAQGLPRVSRAAFAKVLEHAEPGWSDEARRQLATLDREIAREDADFTAYQPRGRAMISGGAPITVEDVRRFPTWARIHVLDAIRVRGGRDLVPLQPLAAELDRLSGTSAVAAAISRAEAADPVVRARFTAGYRAVLAGTATPAEIDDLLAKLRAAGHGVDDLRVGAIILSGRASQRIDELRALVAPWHDPWFDLVVVREQIRATWLQGDVRAEAALTAAFAACNGDAWALRCGQLAYDLAERLSTSGRDPDAERWARTATERYRVAGSPVQLRTARALLAEIHRNDARGGLARAEFDELVRAVGDTRCDERRYARIGQASLALFAGDWSAAGTALPAAHPEPGCAEQPDVIGATIAVDLARHTGQAHDVERARQWLAESHELAGGGIAVIGALRLARGGDPAAAEAARAWIAAHRADRDPPIKMARAWGTTTLISDAGARGDWASVLASAIAEHGVALTQPCAVVATFDDGLVTVAAQTSAAAPAVGDRHPITPAELASAHLVPPSVVQALAGCSAIAMLARPPLHGRSDLLPATLPWTFAGDRPGHAPGGGAPRSVDISDARPPDPSLVRLAPASPGDRFDTSLTGADATPSRVLAALAGATYAELHVHGVAAAAHDDATYLALSPDRDGTFALRADAVRAARLAGAPIIVLAACRASTVAPYLYQRWSLPDAFLAAGASAVIAADVAIPDASARRVFGALRGRITAGEPVEAAVAAIRAAATGDAAWAAHLMVFR